MSVLNLALIWCIFFGLLLADVLLFKKVLDARVDERGYEAWLKSAERMVCYLPFGSIVIWLRIRWERAKATTRGE